MAFDFPPRTTVRRIYDWARDCPLDVARRRFPALEGKGRGRPIEPFVCIRCGRESWRPFNWAHRPVDSDIRTCGGRVVKRSEVEQARKEERQRFLAAVTTVARQESGGYSSLGPAGGGLWGMTP